MLSLEGNRLGLLLGALMLLAGLLYSETVMAIWALWNNHNNPTYSHGPLLLLVSLFFLYREWSKNKNELSLKVSYFGLIGIAGSSLLWFLAAIGSVQIIQMLSLIALFVFVFISLLGYQQAKTFLFPILLLIGALPVWGVFVPYLQLNTAVIAGWLTSLTIQPSIREGMLINIPAGSFEVETSCSGLSYFIVSIIISSLFVYSHRASIKQSLFFVVMAMIVAIVSNIIRVYIIIFSGELTNMQSYFITQEHISLGWVVFAIAISLYLWGSGRFISGQQPATVVGRELEDDKTYQLAQVHDCQSSEEQNGEGELLNAYEGQSATQSNRVWMLAVLGVIAAVVVGPLVNAAFQAKTYQPVSFQVQLPESINGWKRMPYTGSYRPSLQKGDAMQEASFQNAGEDSRIYVLVNYFFQQRQGAEAVSDMNRLAKGRNWTRISSHRISPSIAGFSDIEETMLRTRNGEEKLVWYWYETNDYRTSRKWLAKLQNVIGILKGRPSIRMIVLAIESKSDVTNARVQLRTFLQKIEPHIQIVSHSI